MEGHARRPGQAGGARSKGFRLPPMQDWLDLYGIVRGSLLLERPRAETLILINRVVGPCAEVKA